MAKSIRSKCKRKARAEFRRTIGEEFHKKKMTEIQEKLKECVEQQSSMKSLTRVADLLGTARNNEDEEQVMDLETTAATKAVVTIDDLEESSSTAVRNLKGENKVPVKKKSKRTRKHGLQAEDKKSPSQEHNKQRPRFFVQF